MPISRDIGLKAQLIKLPEPNPHLMHGQLSWQCTLDDYTHLILNYPRGYNKGDYIVIQYEPSLPSPTKQHGIQKNCSTDAQNIQLEFRPWRNRIWNEFIIDTNVLPAPRAAAAAAAPVVDPKRYQIVVDSSVPQDGTTQILSYIKERGPISANKTRVKIEYQKLTPGTIRQIQHLNGLRSAAGRSAPGLSDTPRCQDAVRARSSLSTASYACGAPGASSSSQVSAGSRPVPDKPARRVRWSPDVTIRESRRTYVPRGRSSFQQALRTSSRPM